MPRLFAQSSTAVTSFVIRAQNAVAYHSPTWNGLSAKLHYTTNEFKNAAGFQNPELYSASLGYDTGKMLVGIAAVASSKVAWLPGVGMPSPNLSHFTATDLWGQGASSAAASDTGWLGRYADGARRPQHDRREARRDEGGENAELPRRLRPRPPPKAARRCHAPAWRRPAGSPTRFSACCRSCSSSSCTT